MILRVQDKLGLLSVSKSVGNLYQSPTLSFFFNEETNKQNHEKSAYDLYVNNM